MEKQTDCNLKMEVATISTDVDNLTYNYYTGTNQLRQVNDPISSSNYSNDIDDQSYSLNYVYDNIGNMIKDASTGITLIDTLDEGGNYAPFRINYLANEVGDIDFFFKNVIPNPVSFQKWKTTANSKYLGDWNDTTGAGQLSFKNQTNFKTQFNNIRKKFSAEKVDRINWITHR